MITVANKSILTAHDSRSKLKSTMGWSLPFTHQQLATAECWLLSKLRVGECDLSACLLWWKIWVFSSFAAMCVLFWLVTFCSPPPCCYTLLLFYSSARHMQKRGKKVTQPPPAAFWLSRRVPTGSSGASGLDASYKTMHTIAPLNDNYYGCG